MNNIDALDRRRFCQQVLALAAGGLALPTLRAEDGAATDSYYEAFARNRYKPWTQGFAGIHQDLPRMQMQLTGKFPTELRGTLFRNGPGQHSMGDVRYQHLFDGDGLVQKYQIDAGRITHEARFVRTEKFVAESRAGRFSRATFGTNPPGMEPATSPNAINAANTSIVHHHGELLALWEAGPATRLDPETLETLGTKIWRPDYAGMPFSAHPKLEPDGSLWNFGVSSASGMLSIYRISSRGNLLAAHTHTIPQMTMVHDFAITERHLIFLLPPLVFDIERVRAGATILNGYVWKPELGLRVVVVDKNDLTRLQWFEVPAGFVFHVGNAWEKNGKIFLDFVRSADAWWPLNGIPQIMRGEYSFANASPYIPKIALMEIDLAKGSARQTVLDLSAEFPVVDPRAVGQAHNSLYACARLGHAERPGFDAILRLDRRSGKAQHYRYGDDYLVEEHVFIPRPGSTRQDDGWLLGSALDCKRQATVLSVFDPHRINEGPIAQARMERVLPIGLHASFVAA